MKFKPTPQGFEQARQYATKIGKLSHFNSIKDSYRQLHIANGWYEERQNS